MTVAWGPWEALSDVLTLHGRGDSYCSFGTAGIAALQDGEHVGVAWSDVLGIEVEVPTCPLWLWWLLAPLFLLSQSTFEQSQEVYVRVATRRGTTHVHLGRPARAPYPLRCRAGTEAIFAVLEAGRLRTLLDSGDGEFLIRTVRGSAHWSAAVSVRRLRHALVQMG